MKTKDFGFDLPKELIAQTPLKDRSASKLMVLSREDGTIEHHTFKAFSNYFKRGDVLVLNDSKVIPARLFGIKAQTGAHIECLILRQEEETLLCMVRNARAVKAGTEIIFGEGELRFKCVEVLANGLRRFEYHSDVVLLEALAKLGTMPLPPYIKERLDDPNRYQTIYAKHDGSAAAPTAGLHFTPEIFSDLEKKGVEVHFVTLHVGLGTFKPVDAENIEDHVMHEEYYSVSAETADALNKAKQEGRRITAVGTTSVRTLESQMKKHGRFVAETDKTDIYITPGYSFKAIDGLLTNFHLPESSLIMLVSALIGYNVCMEAYRTAIEEKYRFFSFGDAMLIQ